MAGRETADSVSVNRPRRWRISDSLRAVTVALNPNTRLAAVQRRGLCLGGG